MYNFNHICLTTHFKTGCHPIFNPCLSIRDTCFQTQGLFLDNWYYPIQRALAPLTLSIGCNADPSTTNMMGCRSIHKQICIDPFNAWFWLNAHPRTCAHTPQTTALRSLSILNSLNFEKSHWSILRSNMDQNHFGLIANSKLLLLILHNHTFWSSKLIVSRQS